MPTVTPRFRELDQDEIAQVLREHVVGRLAFAFHDRVDIEPVHFVLDGEWIYGRTTPGTKLTVLAHHPWVAFEVDEVEGPFDWHSVVVKGTVYFVEDGPSHQLRESYNETLRVIRRLMPDALTDRDPVPARSILFRIHINESTGRAATTKG